MVDSKLTVSQQCALEANRANCTMGCIMPSTDSWLREGIVLLCAVRPHLEHCLQFWAPQYKGRKVLESIQMKATKMVISLEGKMCEERLRSLGLFSPEQSRLRGGLMAACSSLTRGAEGQALSSALWRQRQDPRGRHGAGTGEGQAGG